jgi:hypothetical protein
VTGILNYCSQVDRPQRGKLYAGSGKHPLRACLFGNED